MRVLSLVLVLAVGCGSSEPAGGPSDGAAPPADAAMAPPDGGTLPDGAPAPKKGIAAKHPGDVGIESDPDVVFAEAFEQGSLSAVTARYEDKKPGGLSLSADVPPRSSGKASMKMYADPGAPAADLFKRLSPGYDELWVRYYAKYDKGVHWHHTGVWFGGYNPASSYPNPQAGLKPTGDDRFSVSFEPIGADGSNAPRLDFYNYWMKMHSWMDVPSGSTAYYGNSLVHMKSVRVRDDAWMCVEIHAKLNPDPASGAGAELDLWVDGAQVAHFDDTAPVGCWIKDKFCPATADGNECTDYPNLCAKPLVPLDLQYRSTSALKLNALWPQNYVTAGPGGSVYYDDMVVAKAFIGCIE